MSSSTETLARMLVLYSLIPKHATGATASTLAEKLHDRGFSISERSIQRDLKKLAQHFPIGCHDNQLPYRWHKIADTDLDNPEQSQTPPGALAYTLVEQHLSRLLPQNILDYLAPRFRTARNYLDGLPQNVASQWARRVRSLPNGKALLPAKLHPQVWENVSAAVAGQKQIAVTYLSRSQENTQALTLNPAGLVNRHSITYLVANVEGYDDLRRFALHRIQHAQIKDTPCNTRDDFDIDTYIANGAFGWQQGNPKRTTLTADIRPQLAWLLRETPLSEDQHIEGEEAGWHRLTATVDKDQETLWWILGLNSQIRVWGPEEWATEIQVRMMEASALYSAQKS